MEKGKSLTKYITERNELKNPFTEKEIFWIMYYLLKAGYQLIFLKIAHRDIKCDNILVFNEDLSLPGSIKISDYGLSIFHSEESIKTLDKKST